MKDLKTLNNLENLKKLREEKGISQKTLSVELSISQEIISRYEIGSSFPQPATLIKIANYFNCSTDYLLGRTDIKTPIKSLVSNSSDIKKAELYDKYCSLSKGDRDTFDKFLEFLLSNK